MHLPPNKLRLYMQLLKGYADAEASPHQELVAEAPVVRGDFLLGGGEDCGGGSTVRTGVEGGR